MLDDLEVTDEDAEKVTGSKKLPGKRNPPTVTLN